jgi:hypothetical protein
MRTIEPLSREVHRSIFFSTDLKHHFAVFEEERQTSWSPNFHQTIILILTHADTDP